MKRLLVLGLLTASACAKAAPTLDENPKLSAYYSTHLAAALPTAGIVMASTPGARANALVAPLVTRITYTCVSSTMSTSRPQMNYEIATKDGRSARGQRQGSCLLMGNGKSFTGTFDIQIVSSTKVIVSTSGEERSEAYSDEVARKYLHESGNAFQYGAWDLESKSVSAPKPSPTQVQDSWK